MKTWDEVTVELEKKHYPIYIGQNMLREYFFKPHIAGQQVFIVTNTCLAEKYLPQLRAAFSHFDCNEMVLPEGEEYKTLDTFSKIIDALIACGHRRNTTLVALGGGVIGDITGFVAACYQRGVDFIQVPTTLLAQVDASVGGKTGVNHPKAKNMIGAFHQPRAVIIDIATLNTLPDREFYSGLAEMIKMALICDREFFDWLEENLSSLLERQENALRYAITKACTLKAKMVALDETEKGIRALLNLGHTFGHAIEHSLGYGHWLHGEAVAVGIVLAAQVSQAQKVLDAESVFKIKNLLTKAHLPIRLPNSLKADQLIAQMSLDKKKEDKKLKLVLLKGIGEAILVSEIDTQLLRKTITDTIL